MKNRIALITGGMGGLGTAMCRYFSSCGAKVIAAYSRDEDRALKWQEEQFQLGFEIDIIYVDVADFASCAQMAEQLFNKYKNIDILINNAGITRDKRLSTMELQDWLAVMNTNLNSIFNVTRNLINRMIENNYGRIISIASINAQRGQFGQTNYAASKSAMYGFTRSLAQEVARKNITVNTISPGYANTEMVLKIPSEIRNKIIHEIPMNRLAEPNEIARLAGFLASEESAYITGADFPINGGLRMG